MIGPAMASPVMLRWRRARVSTSCHTPSAPQLGMSMMPWPARTGAEGAPLRGPVHERWAAERQRSGAALSAAFFDWPYPPSRGIDAYSGEPLYDEYGQSKKAAESAAPFLLLLLPAAHARRRPVGRAAVPLRGQHGRVPPEVRRPTRSGRRSSAKSVNTIMITGDAMGRPLIEALERQPDRYDLSSLSSRQQQRGRLLPDR